MKALKISPLNCGLISLVAVTLGQTELNAQHVDFLSTEATDWKRSLVLNTSVPGSIQREGVLSEGEPQGMTFGDEPDGESETGGGSETGGSETGGSEGDGTGTGGSDANGVMLWRDDPVVDSGSQYSIGGFFHLRDGIAFSHGYYAPDTPDLGVVTNHGFGIQFQNNYNANPDVEGIDNVVLQHNGSTLTLTTPELNFDFPDNGDGSAYVNYRFNFVQIDRQGWRVTGNIVNNKGVTILDVKEDFAMNIFEAEFFGAQVDPLLVTSTTRGLDVRNINGLSWEVTTVPEPSSSVLLAMGSFFLLTYRNKSNMKKCDS